MPTVFTHAFLGVAVANLAGPRRRGLRWRVALVAALLALLPDADTIGLYLGVPYAHVFGHRGFFHSIAFAAITALVATFLFRERRAHLFVLFFVVAASHGVLDAMTNGGLGIALLAPFSDERFFFPFRPILVAPLSIPAFFSPWGFDVMATEIVLLWVPLLLALLVQGIVTGRQHRTE